MAKVPPSKLIGGKEYLSIRGAIQQIGCTRRKFYGFYRRILLAEASVYVDRLTKNAPRWYLADAVKRLGNDDQQPTGTLIPQPLPPDLDWDTSNTMTVVRSHRRDEGSAAATAPDWFEGVDLAVDNRDTSGDDIPF